MFTAAAFCISAFSGCIHHEETVYRDVARTTVSFENDTAARIFYEALSKSSSLHDRNEGSTEVHIPIVFRHKRRLVDGANVTFNKAVEICDSDGNRRITESEAKIFDERGGD